MPHLYNGYKSGEAHKHFIAFIKYSTYYKSCAELHVNCLIHIQFLYV